MTARARRQPTSVWVFNDRPIGIQKIKASKEKSIKFLHLAIGHLTIARLSTTFHNHSDRKPSMKAVAFNMHQYRAAAAPAPIRAKLRNIRSRQDTDISFRLKCCHDVAVCYVLDPGYISERPEFSTMRPRPHPQTLGISSKGDCLALVRNRGRPLRAAIRCDGFTLDEFSFGDAEGR